MNGGEYVGAASIELCSKELSANKDTVVLLSAKCWKSDASRKLVNQGHRKYYYFLLLYEYFLSVLINFAVIPISLPGALACPLRRR